MTMAQAANRNGVYYSARRDRSTGWRAVIAVFERGRRIWQKTHGLPLTCPEHALERAGFEANSYADTQVPRPHVAPLRRAEAA